MTYTPHNWKAEEAGGTPITDTALNEMEAGIAGADAAAEEAAAKADAPSEAASAAEGKAEAAATAAADAQAAAEAAQQTADEALAAGGSGAGSGEAATCNCPKFAFVTGTSNAGSPLSGSSGPFTFANGTNDLHTGMLAMTPNATTQNITGEVFWSSTTPITGDVKMRVYRNASNVEEVSVVHYAEASSGTVPFTAQVTKTPYITQTLGVLFPDGVDAANLKVTIRGLSVENV